MLRLHGAVIVAVVATLGVGVGGAQGRTDAAEARFALKVAQSAIAVQLDPNMDTVGDAYWYYMNAFDGLTFIDFKRGKPSTAPALATSWSRLNATTWRFNLRRGVTFSNGEAFGSDDVKFTIDRVLNPATRSPVASRIATVDHVVLRGAYAVDIVTKGLDLLLPGRLAVIFIQPKDYFASAGTEGFLRAPVGTGPYRVDSFTRGERLELVRSPRSWRKAHATRVSLLAMPEAAARIAALKAGGVDLVQNVPFDQIQSLRGGGYKVGSALQGRTFLVNMNVRSGGPLADVRVRRALNYAIDKRSIVRHLLGGVGFVAQGQPIGPNGIGYNPRLRSFPYNPTLARQLLAQAGYPNGFSIRMDATNGFYPNDLPVEQYIVQQLRDVGVRVDLNVLGTSAYVASIFGGRNDQMIFHGLNYFPVMDGDFLMSLYQCDRPQKWQCSPEYDALFAKTLTATSQAKRVAALQAVSKYLNENPFAIYLYHIPSLIGSQRAVTGVQIRPDLVVVFDKIRK